MTRPSFIIKTFYAAAPCAAISWADPRAEAKRWPAPIHYPADYDGVIAGYPAYNIEAMHMGSMDYGKALYNAHTAGVDGYKYTLPGRRRLDQPGADEGSV